MIDSFVNNILRFSIIVSIIISLVRFRKIDKLYYPFIILLFLGFVSELVAITTLSIFGTNALSSNIYSLFEALVIVWQFRKWHLLKNFKLYVFLQCIIPGMWISELIYWNNINIYLSVFTTMYAFIIVLLSIQMINHLITTISVDLLKNSIFLICAGFVIFFTFNIVVEVFWIFNIDESLIFGSYVYVILSIINFLINLVYALAVLWIPPKQNFILPSSSPR